MMDFNLGRCVNPPPPPPPPPSPRGALGAAWDLTFIKANRPWLGDNNRSNVLATWFNKRSNDLPDYVKRVAQ